MQNPAKVRYPLEAVAARLCVSVRVVRTLIQSGKLRALKVSGDQRPRYAVTEEDLASYEESVATRPPGPAAPPPPRPRQTSRRLPTVPDYLSGAL